MSDKPVVITPEIRKAVLDDVIKYVEARPGLNVKRMLYLLRDACEPEVAKPEVSKKPFVFGSLKSL